MNTKIIAEIEKLKEERNKMLALQEKTAKENNMLQVKYAQANMKLQNLMKKFGKSNNAPEEKQQSEDGNGCKQEEQPNDKENDPKNDNQK